MRTLIIIITSILLSLLLLRLRIMKIVTKRAYAPLIPDHDLAYSVTIGGPAPGAAGTPQKRGPLPPPTCGRGRLPTSRAELRMELGPQLPWHDASSTYRNLPATELMSTKRQRPGMSPASRLAMAMEAMVRLGMAAPSPLGTSRPCSLKASRRHPARPLAAALAQGHRFLGAQNFLRYVTHEELSNGINVHYLAADARNPDGQAPTIIVIGLSTPIHAQEPGPIIIFIMLFILWVI